MAALYITQVGALALQSAGIAGWTNLKAELTTAIPQPPGRLPTAGELPPAAWAGYANIACTLTGGFVNGPAGKTYCESNLLGWTGPAAGGGGTVQGLALIDGTTNAIFAWIDLGGAQDLLDATYHLSCFFQLFEGLTAFVFLGD